MLDFKHEVEENACPKYDVHRAYRDHESACGHCAAYDMAATRQGGISKSHWKRGLRKLLGMELGEGQRRELRSAIDPSTSDGTSSISAAAWGVFFAKGAAVSDASAGADEAKTRKLAVLPADVPALPGSR